MASVDPRRIPPGQRLVNKLPVLHAGSVMHVRPDSWSLAITGLVAQSGSLDLPTLLALPSVEQTSDLHCVTGWTMLDTRWRGVRIQDVLAGTEILPEARHAVVHASGGWTTNLPLEELLRDDVLVAYEYEGRPLSSEHGGPVRLLVPRLYFWKSAKWLSGLEFTADQRLGYWERRGYHALGDPWLEQRYS
jgi:DMSO/TMAO reductase YedYZ molybdopterin-dependent catalytic subunit